MFAAAHRHRAPTETARHLARRSGAVSATGNRCGDVDRKNHQHPSNTNNAWNVNFSNGSVSNNNKNNAYRARVVRKSNMHTDSPISIQDVLEAWQDCRKRKRITLAAIAFEERLSDNIRSLHRDLVDGSYAIGPSTCFVVLNPKPREVWAAGFRDRVVHHLLYRHIAPRFIRRFADDSCACLPGRGTLYGVKRLESKIRRVTENWTVPAYYLKCDFANFFNSIDRRILDVQLAAHIHAPWWLALTRQVLHHDPRQSAVVRSSPEVMAQVPPHKSLFVQDAHHGLPIGNLSSQFFANVFLDDLDQFVLHMLRPAGYVRYVDDFILLHRNPRMLSAALRRIERFSLDRLGLKLNPSKTIIQPIDRGVDFVGHVIKPHHMVARKRLTPTAIHKAAGIKDRGKRRDTLNSYLGLLRHGSNYRQQARITKAARLLDHSHSFTAEKVYS